MYDNEMICNDFISAVHVKIVAYMEAIDSMFFMIVHFC